MGTNYYWHEEDATCPHCNRRDPEENRIHIGKSSAGCCFSYYAKKAYEQDVLKRPNYHDGAPRKTWDELDNLCKESWCRHPLDQLDEASRESWEERAAIAEYDGGLSRKDAEALAWKQLKMMPEMKEMEMNDTSTLQTLFNRVQRDGGYGRLRSELMSERAKTQMTLGEMIATLKDMHSIARIEGLSEPHSYRGYYEDLAFEPTEGIMRVGELLDLCKSAMGKAYEGYKGGTFVMGEMTPVWVAHYGQTGKRLIAINRDGQIETAEEEE